jgi:hypothetical protein
LLNQQKPIRIGPLHTEVRLFASGQPFLDVGSDGGDEVGDERLEMASPSVRLCIK